MSKSRLPAPEALASTLRSLFGRAVTGKVLPALVAPVATSLTASYELDDGTVGGACILDVQLAASLGAALALMPPAVAAEAVRRGALDAALLENVHEVLNICTGLFEGGDAPHVRLGAVGAGAVPPAVQAMLKVPRNTVCSEVAVQGYPAGRLIAAIG